MKKFKKTIPKIKTETVINEYYQIQCPHCKTYFQGGFGKRSIRILCSGCNNPIEIEWDKAIYVTHLL
jgi:ribosomal protein S27E